MTSFTQHRLSLHPAAAPLDALWLPVGALVCGVLSAAAVLSPVQWTGLQALSLGVVSAAAVALGYAAVSRQERGQALAMTGVALGAAGLMGTVAACVL